MVATERKFCVGLNGERSNPLEILQTYGSHIYGVFGTVPPDVLGGARIGHKPVTHEQLRDDIAIAHQFGVGYDVVLNASTLEFTPNWQKTVGEFLDFAEKTKLDGVSIAHPDLLKFVLKRRPETLKVIVSSFCDVITVDRAQEYEALGIDRIILHQNANRNLPELKRIRESVDCELELYVNNGCTYTCGVRKEHRDYQAKVSTLQLVEADHFREDCIAFRDANPVEIVKAVTIRPEDLHIYEDLGFNMFKIAARTQSTEWTLGVLSAYINRRFDGLISELCDTNRGRIYRIPNRRLDGLLDYVGWHPEEYEQRCEEFYQTKVAGK